MNIRGKADAGKNVYDHVHKFFSRGVLKKNGDNHTTAYEFLVRVNILRKKMHIADARVRSFRVFSIEEAWKVPHAISYMSRTYICKYIDICVYTTLSL